MRQIRQILIAAFIVLAIGAIIAIAAAFMPSGGLRNGLFLAAAVFVGIFLMTLYAGYRFYREHKSEIQEEIERSKQIKNENGGNAETIAENLGYDSEFIEMMRNRYNDAVIEIGELYKKTDFYTKTGYAIFAKEGLEFKIEGKYAAVKDFKGIAGYHLAFEIRSVELTEMPEEYEDICDYESIGFRIDVGYFDECALSVENENGVIVNDMSDMCGKVIRLSSGAGYYFQVVTMEWDYAETGEIKVIKWDENEKVISFKVGVPWGLADVVTGTVSLTQDMPCEE